MTGTDCSVVVVVSQPERIFVYSVKDGLTDEEANDLFAKTVIDAQEGRYIFVTAYGRRYAINPRYIIEVRIEGWRV